MTYALIGCGRIAPNHVAAVVANKLDFLAVCDIVPDHMEKVLEPVSAVIKSKIKRYTDYHQLLDEQQPTLVAIATESGKHAAIALDCINAGCHVIIEKPLALSLDDADAIINTAKQKNVIVCANHQNRFNKSVQYIKKAIEAGRFGRLLHGTAHIRWNRGQDYYSQASWRGTWAQDGGALMNQCIHNIDLLRWIMGNEIDEVFAYTDNLLHPYIEAEDLGIGLVKFHNGSYGIIEGTINIYQQNLEETLYLFGETGTIKAGGKSVNIIEEWIFADQLDDPEYVKATYHENPPNVYGYGHTPLYADVIDAIKTGRAPYISGEDGKRAIELVLAIYKSAATGMPVKLPLSTCSTMDFAGRFDSIKSVAKGELL
jgi:UDP-N-acetyl-2-amino-2-deoxyglucuronate dehydrogenase